MTANNHRNKDIVSTWGICTCSDLADFTVKLWEISVLLSLISPLKLRSYKKNMHVWDLKNI